MRKLTLTEEALLLLDEFLIFSYRPMLKMILDMQGYDRRSALINQLSKLRKEGYVEKIKKEGKVFFKITEAGKIKIQRAPLPIHKESRKWDGKWRVVIFDIPEKNHRQRDRLRQKLKELGFGMLQQSVWISPHDIFIKVEKIIENYGLKEYMFIFDTNYLSEDNQNLAEKVWNLKKINNQYGEFLLRFEVFRKTKNDEERAVLLARMRDAISLILYNDPQLPEELLPEDWYGFDAWRFYQECRSSLKRKICIDEDI